LGPAVTFVIAFCEGGERKTMKTIEFGYQ